MKKHYVFTYGTLLRGERNHHLLNDLDFVCEAKVMGFEMFNLGTYPGIYDGNGTILGEIYYVNDETLKELDILEEEGSLYTRRIVKAYSMDKEYDVFIYVYNQKELNPKYIGENIYSWKKRK